MTKSPLNPQALEQVFFQARTFNKFTDKPVTDATLQQIYDLCKWGPTAFNSQPTRFAFVRSPDAKNRLKPSLMAGNLDKTMSAPVCVIVAQDMKFQNNLPEQFPAFDAKPMFDANADMTAAQAFRGSTLQGAYFIIAARSLGLDCGPMTGFDNAKVDAEFFAGTTFKSNFLINLGYGDESGNYPRGPRLSFDVACQTL